MKIANRRIIEKYLKKKRGNKILADEIKKLFETIENANWSTARQIKESRPDADKVHPDGFYFFNISYDRMLILIEIEESQATIVWCGNHKKYESTFKNNKRTIRKWLQTNNWI